MTYLLCHNQGSGWAPFYARFWRRVGYHVSPTALCSLGSERTRISCFSATANFMRLSLMKAAWSFYILRGRAWGVGP